MISKKNLLTVVIIIIFISFIVLYNKIFKNNETSGITQKKMEGETFCLYDQQEKVFFIKPKEVVSVYGYNEDGKLIIYNQNLDYIVDYDKGSIKRTYNSRIPNYREHKVYYENNGKFIFNSNPRNPELNIKYQIHVDYLYDIQPEEKENIADESYLISDNLKDKILNKKGINISVIGDSIAAGAQTTSQYYYGDGIKDSFSGYLKRSIETYYKCSVNIKLAAKGGTDRGFLLSNINNIIQQKPDVAIVEFGMNDHVVTGSLNSDNINSFIQDIEYSVIQFKENNINVIIVGFFQQNTEWDCENVDATIKYNNALKEISKRNGIYFADIYSLYNKVANVKNIYEDLTADYMHHPSDWGGKIYLTGIIPVFNVGGSIRPVDLQDYIYIE